MAEERLIDDDIDKDKKYSFRTNENGEEELIIQTGEPSSEEEAVLSPDEADNGEGYAYGDGAADEMTAAAYIELARGESDKNNYSTALEYLSEAKKLDPQSGEIAALGLYIYTKGLTDYSRGALDGAVDAAKDVAEYCSAEDKKKLADLGADRLKGMIADLEVATEDLNARNEQGKADRAVRFVADCARAKKLFFPVLSAFVVFLALAVCFGVMFFSLGGAAYQVAAIVFAAVCFVSFCALLYAARKLSVTARRVHINLDNSRTQLGREYVASKARLESLRTIYDAITK